MLRSILSTITAAMLAAVGTAGVALAHGHPHHGWAGNAIIVSNGENDDDADAVTVAEPVVTTTQYVAVPQTQYVAVNDAVVTPYGYTPVYSNGYYQGYSYSPQYSYNPYYAAAMYSGYTGYNPLTTAVISTVATALQNNGHVSTSDVLTSLLSGFLASQMQPQYQQPYPYGAYPAGYVQQPVYVQQPAVQTIVQQVLVPQTVAVPVPVQPAPVYYIPH